jgi:TPP-dependent pyruvate/acetoin dehydrogenase alpha subunit
VNVEQFYRDIYRIRAVELKIADLYHTDVMKTPMHLSVGQEHISVAVCSNLRPSDKVFGSYRSHALYLAKGGGLGPMVDELFGKPSGCCGGVGGSMHLTDVGAGVMETSAIVALPIPHAVGYAFAEMLAGRDTVVAVFFGDGAAEEGVLWESLNFASIHALNVLFVCENNGLAIDTFSGPRVCTPISERAGGFDVHVEYIDHSHPCQTNAEVERMLGKVGKLSGPGFLELRCHRSCEHVGVRILHDIPNDPVQHMAELMTHAEAAAIRADVDIEVNTAFEAAAA